MRPLTMDYNIMIQPTHTSSQDNLTIVNHSLGDELLQVTQTDEEADSPQWVQEGMSDSDEGSSLPDWLIFWCPTTLLCTAMMMTNLNYVANYHVDPTIHVREISRLAVPRRHRHERTKEELIENVYKALTSTKPGNSVWWSQEWKVVGGPIKRYVTPFWSPMIWYNNFPLPHSYR